MGRRAPGATRTDTLFPYSTRFRARGWRRRYRSPPPVAQTRSQHALGTGQPAAVAPDRLAQRTSHGLEAGLDLVVVVLAVPAQVQRHPRRIAQRAEEVRLPFSREVAHAPAPGSALQPTAKNGNTA